jgi:hypothetical protein
VRILYSAFDPVPWPKGSGTRIEATVRALAAAGAFSRLGGLRFQAWGGECRAPTGADP